MGISETKAQSLYQYGYTSLEGLSKATAEELKDIPEFEKAEESNKLIKGAKELLEKYAKEGKELPKMEEAEKDKKPLSSNLKEQAEEILKRELAQLEGGKEDTTKKTPVETTNTETKCNS